MSSAMKIVTGYTGVAHITAQQDRFINQSFLGTGTCVLPIGNKLNCTIDSATQITIEDGGLSIQGCVAMIDTGDTEVLTVDPGTAGMNRIDYVLAQYYKGSFGVESVTLVVKKGFESSGTPTPPGYTAGSIEGGDFVTEYPIWQINIEGLAIASVERVAPVSQTADNLMAMINSATILANGKAPFYSLTSGSDVYAMISAISIGSVVVYRGSNAFSQDVLGTDSQVNCFGIAYKSSSTQMAFLAVGGGKLYYATYKSDGTGSHYCPLDLQANIE